MSDLHLDHYPDYGASIVEEIVSSADGDEVLVLAGDICGWHHKRQAQSLNAFEAFRKRFSTIVMVPGNHEYWGSRPEDVDETLQQMAARLGDIHVLSGGQAVEVRGSVFRGDTMWFPPEPVNGHQERDWIDFKMIWGLKSYAYRRNSMFREEVLKNGKATDILVTHHTPSYRSVPEQFLDSPQNCFFVSDEPKIFDRVRPRLWIHGHTHTSFSYLLGDTQVVCNPRGYPREGQDSYWDPRKIIEIE